MRGKNEMRTGWEGDSKDKIGRENSKGELEGELEGELQGELEGRITRRIRKENSKGEFERMPSGKSEASEVEKDGSHTRQCVWMQEWMAF